MLYRDSEDEELVIWPKRSVFGKVNSTLGPVVPLAMFVSPSSLPSRCLIFLSRISTKKKCSISILQQCEPLSRGESFSRWKCKLSSSQSQTESTPWFARGRKWKQNQRTHDQAPAAAGLGHFFFMCIVNIRQAQNIFFGFAPFWRVISPSGYWGEGVKCYSDNAQIDVPLLKKGLP